MTEPLPTSDVRTESEGPLPPNFARPTDADKQRVTAWAESIALPEGLSQTPGVMGGRICVKGHRFTAGQLIAELAENRTIGVIADDYQISRDKFTAAVQGVAQILEHGGLIQSQAIEITRLKAQVATLTAANERLTNLAETLDCDKAQETAAVAQLMRENARLRGELQDRDEALMQLPQEFRQHTTGLRESVKRLVDQWNAQAGTIKVFLDKQHDWTVKENQLRGELEQLRKAGK